MKISKKQILASLVAIFAVALVIVPSGNVGALTKKSVAKDWCKNTVKGTFKSKKCIDIPKKNKDDGENWCTDRNVGGMWSKQTDGKFMCTWTKFASEDSYDETDTSSDSGNSENDNDTGTYGAGVNKVVGEVKEECEDGVKTSILGGGGCYTDDGQGSGVYEILLIILNILTGGVGVLGVLGLIVSGVTYLTARDNEQQVAKAKQRILQIVIGLLVFAVLYVGLQWLIPGGIFGN